MSISGSKLKLPTKPVYLHLFNDCLLLSRRKEWVTFSVHTKKSWNIALMMHNMKSAKGVARKIHPFSVNCKRHTGEDPSLGPFHQSVSDSRSLCWQINPGPWIHVADPHKCRGGGSPGCAPAALIIEIWGLFDRKLLFGLLISSRLITLSMKVVPLSHRSLRSRVKMEQMQRVIIGLPQSIKKW